MSEKKATKSSKTPIAPAKKTAARSTAQNAKRAEELLSKGKKASKPRSQARNLSIDDVLSQFEKEMSSHGIQIIRVPVGACAPTLAGSRTDATCPSTPCKDFRDDVKLNPQLKAAEPEVDIGLHFLDSQISILFGVMESLGSKLDPILSPPSPATPNPALPPTPPATTKVSSVICEQASRVRRLVEIANEYLERAQV